MSDPRYFSVMAPAPWNKSGTTKVTVRTGGAYEVYVCVGNDRSGMTEGEAWALWTALGNALHAACGDTLAWAADQAVSAKPAKKQGGKGGTR